MCQPQLKSGRVCKRGGDSVAHAGLHCLRAGDCDASWPLRARFGKCKGAKYVTEVGCWFVVYYLTSKVRVMLAEYYMGFSGLVACWEPDASIVVDVSL